MLLCKAMKENQMSKSALIVTLLSCIIPAFILIIPASAEIALIILALWSLFYCVQNNINPFSYASSQFIAYLCLGYFMVALISILASEPSLYAFKRLGTNIHFLLAPWLAVLFIKELNLNLLRYAIKLGACLAGVVALIQYFYLNQRAHGCLNELPFSNISLLLSFFSLINIHQEKGREKYISLFSFTLGFMAVIFSLSRGTWIAVPILFIIIVLLWYKQRSITIKALSVFTIIGICLITISAFSPQVQSRFNSMLKDINTYEVNTFTPVGIRITLWKTAIKAIPEHPFLGFGLHNVQQVTYDYIDDPILKESLQIFGHFHNEYLNTLVTKGVLGLLMLLTLLIIPCTLFYPLLSNPNNFYTASLIILLCAGYAMSGLTNLAFGHGIMNSFFIFMLTASSQILPTQRISQTL